MSDDWTLPLVPPDRDLAGEMKVRLWAVIEPVLRESETGLEVQSILMALGDVAGMLIGTWRFKERAHLLAWFQKGLDSAIATEPKYDDDAS